MLLQVGGQVSLGRSGPVELLVYRIRRNGRMALCIVGIVGRRSTDIASNFDEMYKLWSLLLLLPWTDGVRLVFGCRIHSRPGNLVGSLYFARFTIASYPTYTSRPFSAVK